jgi:xylitol oxidase
MASLPHISVAGAVATATHGSGDANGNLATVVAAMELVTADGTLATVSREQHGERFGGMVVSLGALGIVTKLTLEVVPSFVVRQEAYESLPVAQLEAHFEDILSHAYSVSLFTDWQTDRVNQVWVKRRLAGDAAAEVAPAFFEATAATVDRHPIMALSAESCTPQLGVPGPWHERLPHFRMEFTPSSGEELQTEYFVPRRHAVAALRAVAELRAQLGPLLLISELRTIAADALWLSPCYRQACLGLHFTWKPDWPAVRRLLPALEAQLAPFEARPHWGKLFTLPPARLQSLYARLPDFRALLRLFDPAGKFRNAFIDTYIG